MDALVLFFFVILVAIGEWFLELEQFECVICALCRFFCALFFFFIVHFLCAFYVNVLCFWPFFLCFVVFIVHFFCAFYVNVLCFRPIWNLCGYERQGFCFVHLKWTLNCPIYYSFRFGCGDESMVMVRSLCFFADFV